MEGTGRLDEAAGLLAQAGKAAAKVCWFGAVRSIGFSL
jgi:hypothetical protein